jgi:hypothetical protein
MSKNLYRAERKAASTYMAACAVGHLFSAGLKQADFIQPIIFGGVKSMVGKLDKDGKSIFGFRDLLIIDEVQLSRRIAADADYTQFILELMAINPYLKIIGLSATDLSTWNGAAYERSDLYGYRVRPMQYPRLFAPDR